MASLGLVVFGLVFSFAYDPVVLHKAGWQSPADVWLSYRGAQYTTWGDFTDGLQYVSAPGTALLFVPVAFVADRLHLVSSYIPFFLSKPSAWIVLAPYDLIVSTTAIFAFDRLAEQFDLSAGRRQVLLWLEVLAMLVIVEWFGHPEDVVAMAFALWALSAGMNGRWGYAGWLFGAAIVLQPITVLVLLPVLALTSPRTWVSVGWRAIVPTAVVMATPLFEAWGETMRFLHQPNFIAPNHPTPLLWLAPAAGKDFVDTGPLRLLCVLLAAIIAWVAYRRRATPLEVVWCIGLTLSLRVALEPVLDPYYVWPAVAVLLLVVMALSSRTSWISVPLLGFVTVYALPHLAGWVYWLPLVGALSLVLAVTGADIRRREGERTSKEPPAAGQVPAGSYGAARS